MEASNNQGRTIRFRVRGEVKFEEEEKQGGAFPSRPGEFGEQTGLENGSLLCK